MKNSKPVKYFGELIQLPNGKFKATKMKKLVWKNQYKRGWQPVNSRDFARLLNRSQIIIK